MSISIFGNPPKGNLINFHAHSGQEEIAQSIIENQKQEIPSSVFTFICGRGYGKTLWLGSDIVVPFMDLNPGVQVMWVAPTYQIAMTLIDDVFKGINEATGERYIPEFDQDGNRVWEFVTTRSGPQLKWYNGSVLHLRSADAPDSIVSKGYNMIVIDEAALISERVFTLQILGTARKQGIKIILITTPRGKRHFTYNLYLKGQDPKEKNYLSFRHPYTKNPYYNKTQAELVKDIPEWIFRQEYLAEFTDDGNSVFKDIDSIADGKELFLENQNQEWSKSITDIKITSSFGESNIPAAERRFVVGLDLAKSVDYTVMWGMCLDSGECIYYKRFNKTDYREVLDTVSKVCKSLNYAELIFDSTGVGSGLSDYFNNYDISSNPYSFTNESKNELINKLIVAVEHKEITIPNIQTVKNEFNAFTYTLTRTNKISYGAPSGFHDDIVIAAALANWYRSENTGATRNIEALDDVIDFNSGKSNNPNSFFDFMENDDD